MHGEQISQGRELFVREAGRQLVQEMNQAAAGCSSLLFVQCFALRTSTIGVMPVILADGNHLHARIGLEDGIYPVGDNLKQFRIGHAPLAG